MTLLWCNVQLYTLQQTTYVSSKMQILIDIISFLNNVQLFQNGCNSKKTAPVRQSSLFTQIGKRPTSRKVTTTTEVASDGHQVSPGCHGDADDDCVIISATPKQKPVGKKTALFTSKSSLTSTFGSNVYVHDANHNPTAKSPAASKLNITQFDSPKGKVVKLKSSSSVISRTKDMNSKEDVKNQQQIEHLQNAADAVSSIPESQEVDPSNLSQDRPNNTNVNQVSSVAPKHQKQTLLTPEGKGATNESAPSPDIIPDTPDSEPGKKSTVRKNFNSRSFLSSSVSLGNAGRIQKKPIAKKPRTQKKRSSSSVVLARELHDGNRVWNSKDESFRSALAETGIDIVRLSTGSNVIGGSGSNGCGVKRLSVKGLSPCPKRLAGMAGVSRRREHGNAVERIRIKLDMQGEREHQNPSATKGNIPSGKRGDSTKESMNLGDGERLGEKTGSVHMEPVEDGSHDGEKEGEVIDEDKDKEGSQSEACHPYRWTSRRMSNICTKTSPENGVQTSDLHHRDATLSDILSELKGPNVTNQRRSSDKTTPMTEGRLNYDLCREDRQGHDPHKHNCVEVASEAIETDVTTANVPSGNHGDTDLMDILSELKEQFAVTQSPCEKNRRKRCDVTNRSVDKQHMTVDITSDLTSSSSVASMPPGGDTSLDDIMRELVPARGPPISDRVLVRNVKVSKRTKMNTPRNTIRQNCSNKENGESSTGEMMKNLKMEESTDIQGHGQGHVNIHADIAVDTNGVNNMATETSPDGTDDAQPLSVRHVTSEDDGPAKLKDEFPETTEDLDSTLMKNFQLDDSLENELNYDFEKMSPFKTAPSNR